MTENFEKTQRPWWVVPAMVIIGFFIVAYQNCADYQIGSQSQDASTSTADSR